MLDLMKPCFELFGLRSISSVQSYPNHYSLCALNIFSCPSSDWGLPELCTERGLNCSQVLTGSSQIPLPEVEPRPSSTGLVPLAEPCQAAGAAESRVCQAQRDALREPLPSVSSCACCVWPA